MSAFASLAQVFCHLASPAACAGGLIFGWNALAIMLKAQGNYNGNCPPDLNARCAWQESHLAVLWTIGVFALNFGPVIVGPVLDYVGPKLTAMLGKACTALRPSC